MTNRIVESGFILHHLGLVRGNGGVEYTCKPTTCVGQEGKAEYVIGFLAASMTSDGPCG